MIERKKARKIIEEIRYIPEYEQEIDRICFMLKLSDRLYHDGPGEVKDPMNWDRIAIQNRDGTTEDARYSAPKNKISVRTNSQLFDYEDELIEELTYNSLALKRAKGYRETLLSGIEPDFMRDYIDGLTMEELRKKYGFANPQTHALCIASTILN